MKSLKDLTDRERLQLITDVVWQFDVKLERGGYKGSLTDMYDVVYELLHYVSDIAFIGLKNRCKNGEGVQGNLSLDLGGLTDENFHN
jgi:hypothetical protein